MTKAIRIRFFGCEVPGKNAFMCIECETVEHYVPIGDMFILQVDTVHDTIHEVDSEERESDDSSTVASTGTEIDSSPQACNDVSDHKYV